MQAAVYSLVSMAVAVHSSAVHERRSSIHLRGIYFNSPRSLSWSFRVSSSDAVTSHVVYLIVLVTLSENLYPTRCQKACIGATLTDMYVYTLSYHFIMEAWRNLSAPTELWVPRGRWPKWCQELGWACGPVAAQLCYW